MCKQKDRVSTVEEDDADSDKNHEVSAALATTPHNDRVNCRRRIVLFTFECLIGAQVFGNGFASQRCSFFRGCHHVLMMISLNQRRRTFFQILNENVNNPFSFCPQKEFERFSTIFTSRIGKARSPAAKM